MFRFGLYLNVLYIRHRYGSDTAQLGVSRSFDRVPLGFRYGIDGVQTGYQMVLRNCFRSAIRCTSGYSRTDRFR